MPGLFTLFFVFFVLFVVQNLAHLEPLCHVLVPVLIRFYSASQSASSAGRFLNTTVGAVPDLLVFRTGKAK